MASLATHVSRVSRKKTTRSVAWAVGLTAAAAAAVGGLLYYSEKSAKAAPKPSPTPTPSQQQPVWSELTPVATAGGTYAVQIPANATFAFADSATDPNLSAIVSGLTQATSNGTIGGVQNYPTNAPAPAGWPSDSFGSAGYRLSAVAKQAFTLSLGPLSGASPSTTPSVWIVTGFTS